MSDAIAICYFSGTGNTAHVVELARQAFTGRGVTFDVFRIEDMRRSGRTEFRPTDYDLLGIAHPVLGFDAPGLVYDFVRTLPEGADTPVFLLKTAADYHSINNSSSYSIRKLLTRRGYRPFYDEIVAMPCNWLVAYDDQLSRQLVEVAPARVEAAVERILAREPRAASNGPLLRAILKVTSLLEDRIGAKEFGKRLVAGDACTRCGRCASDCPADNIALAGGEVRFGGSCTWCMRCVYACPERAIRAGYLDFVVLKGGYDLARIRALPFRPIDYTAPKLAPWHGYFRRYFTECGR